MDSCTTVASLDESSMQAVDGTWLSSDLCKFRCVAVKGVVYGSSIAAHGASHFESPLLGPCLCSLCEGLGFLYGVSPCGLCSVCLCLAPEMDSYS